MTRVGFLLEQCLAPVPGGTARYSRELAAALAATAPDGCGVDGWTALHASTAAAVVPGVAGPHRLPLGRRPLIAAWERGVGPVPRADLVHAPTLLAPPRRGRPLVVTVHDAVPWTHPETLTQRGVAWHRRMGARVAASADLVIVPTAAVRADLAEFLDIGDRVRVVPEGADTIAVPADAAARRDRLGLPERYLCTLATLEPRKGLDVALSALAEAPAPDLPLVVVGQPGWGGVDLDATAGSLGLAADRVRALGRLPDDDLAAVLAGALALVAPSRAEGFGLPVAEAMAAGVPVVCSDAAALVEVTAGAALTVPVGDVLALAEALGEVATDEALRARLVAAGLARAADLTWRNAAEATWAVYGELL
ncbi:MAG TPA: glycosyltransferase family 1 protein [Mycobacteriales bacterium]|nr:glycosyltransferase family 1 protein [Mycobacteriales bacterium]